MDKYVRVRKISYVKSIIIIFLKNVLQRNFEGRELLFSEDLNEKQNTRRFNFSHSQNDTRACSECERSHLPFHIQLFLKEAISQVVIHEHEVKKMFLFYSDESHGKHVGHICNRERKKQESVRLTIIRRGSQQLEEFMPDEVMKIGEGNQQQD